MKLQKKILLALSVCILAVLTASSIDVEAAAAVRQVTVTFDSNGGEDINENKILTEGGAYGTLPVPTRENYTFKGWYSFKSGGVKVTAESTVKLKKNHKLYARWAGNESAITLDANEGNVSTSTVTVYYGSKYMNQLPAPTRQNYTFDGWYTAATGGDKITKNTIFDEDSPETLYAHWKIKTLKVYFITFNNETYEREVTVEETFGELPEPEKEKYGFGGWYTWENYAEKDAEPVTEETVVEKSGRLYLFARWYPGSEN